MNTTLDALRDATVFLAAHPDVAACAMVTAQPEGTVSVQLVQHIADDGTRVGIIYGLAATYSGDIVRHELASVDHIGTDLTWAQGKTVRVYTAVRKIAAVTS